MTSIGGGPVQLSYSSTWAAGYAAAKEAGRAELEWQRAEIERLLEGINTAFGALSDTNFNAEDRAACAQMHLAKTLGRQHCEPSTEELGHTTLNPMENS